MEDDVHAALRRFCSDANYSYLLLSISNQDGKMESIFINLTETSTLAKAVCILGWKDFIRNDFEKLHKYSENLMNQIFVSI